MVWEKPTNPPSDDEDHRAVTIGAESYLIEHGVIGEYEDVDDLCIDSPFADAWMKEIETISLHLEPHDNLALFRFDVNEIEVREQGTGIILKMVKAELVNGHQSLHFALI